MESSEYGNLWYDFLNDTLDTPTDLFEFELKKEEGHAPWSLYFNSIVISGSCLIGFTMNPLIVFLISKHFHSKISLTNILILILALVDIGNLFALGMELAYWIEERWIFGTLLCKVYSGLYKLKFMTSSFILIWLSMDFLNGPSRSQRFRLTWAISTGMTLTIPFVSSLMDMYAMEIKYDLCPPTHQFHEFILFRIIHVLEIISIVLLTPLVIFVWLVKRGTLCKSLITNFENPNQLKTALALTLCHIICWTPHSLIYVWDPSASSMGIITLELILSVPVGILAICSATNPILVLYCRDDLRSFTARIPCIRKLFWRDLSPGMDRLALGESMEGVETSGFA